MGPPAFNPWGGPAPQADDKGACACLSPTACTRARVRSPQPHRAAARSECLQTKNVLPFPSDGPPALPCSAWACAGGSVFSVWGQPAAGGMGGLGGLGAWGTGLSVNASAAGKSSGGAAAPGLPDISDLAAAAPPVQAARAQPMPGVTAQPAAPGPTLPISPPSPVDKQQAAAVASPARMAPLQGPPASSASSGGGGGAGAGGSGPFVCRCKGLPMSATIEKVVAFFEPLELATKGTAVRIVMNEQGLPTGECFVLFASEAALASGLERNKRVMGHKRLLVERATAAELMQAFPPPPQASSAAAAGRGATSPSKQGGGGDGGRGSGESSARGGGESSGSARGGGGTAAHSASKSGPYAAAATAGAANHAGTAAGAAAVGGGRGGAVSSRGGGTGTGGANGASHAKADSGGGGGGSGNIVIKMRGLPYTATESDIAAFFKGLRVAPGGVTVGRDANGRASGEAHVEFTGEQDAQSAMLLNRQRIGNRYIELFRAKQTQITVNRRYQATDGEGAGTSDCLRLRGMPFNSTEADVLAFFKGYPVIPGGVKMGPQTGQGTVRFAHADDARRALTSLNHGYMGSRYIELFYATP
jgi:hypothetical protein